MAPLRHFLPDRLRHHRGYLVDAVIQKTIIRDRVLTLTVELMRRLHSYVSSLPEHEQQVLLKLESPTQFDTATHVCVSIMGLLEGDVPKVDRFDKTRRVASQKLKAVKGEAYVDTQPGHKNDMSILKPKRRGRPARIQPEPTMESP